TMLNVLFVRFVYLKVTRREPFISDNKDDLSTIFQLVRTCLLINVCKILDKPYDKKTDSVSTFVNIFEIHNKLLLDLLSLPNEFDAEARQTLLASILKHVTIF